MILEANILSKLQNKSQLARELGISRGVLYRNHKMPKKDEEIARKIRQVQENHPSYGYRRIAIALKINHKRALRVMQLFDLKVQKKSRIYKKVEKNDQENVNKIKYKNLIAKKKITKPNQVWCADFTYLPSDNKNHKFIFLATVIDAFTREILGFELSVKHDTNLVVNSLFDAIKARRNKACEIFHSDQGSEYKSQEFVNILQSLKIKASFSNKASPWQNGRQESFYQKFKLELGDPRNYNDLGELFAAISKQVFYYNNERIHTALKTSPSLFYLKYVGLQNKRNIIHAN
jgi:hypothetical protein